MQDFWIPYLDRIDVILEKKKHSKLTVKEKENLTKVFENMLRALKANDTLVLGELILADVIAQFVNTRKI
jgi:uncharacterized protein YnzC (UPF0291/DUF896 family)